MLRPCLRQSRGVSRSLCSQCYQLYHRTLPAPSHNKPIAATRFFSSTRPARNTAQTSTITDADRVPLRKQLKNDAKSVKARQRETREKEEASRQQWELTVGVEIHAQLDTEAKLFSRGSTIYPMTEGIWSNYGQGRRRYSARFRIPMSLFLTWRFPGVNRLVFYTRDTGFEIY